jgi:hypothetical protein
MSPPLLHSPDLLGGAKKRVAKAKALRGERSSAYPKLLLKTSSASSQFQGKVARVAKPMTQAPKRQAVGLWRVGEWLHTLPSLVDELNEAQFAFVFFEVQAAIPPGTVSRPDRTIEWVNKELGKQRKRHLTRAEAEEVDDNVVDLDYFGPSDRVRRDLGLDYIVGITGAMIAGQLGNGPGWNFYSSSEKRSILVSTAGLREFSAETGVRLEAYVAYLIIGQLLVAISRKLEFHPDDTGCVFDYDDSRQGMKTSILAPKIDPECMKLIAPAYRPVAQQFLEFLRRYGKPTKSSSKPKG